VRAAWPQTTFNVRLVIKHLIHLTFKKWNFLSFIGPEVCHSPPPLSYSCPPPLSTSVFIFSVFLPILSLSLSLPLSPPLPPSNSLSLSPFLWKFLPFKFLNIFLSPNVMVKIFRNYTTYFDKKKLMFYFFPVIFFTFDKSWSPATETIQD
jgi:hypothetical protein